MIRELSGNSVGAFALALGLAGPALAQTERAATAGSPPPAAEQDQATDGGQVDRDLGNDIFVTARRREERLQDVPVSVTALSGELLTQKNVRSVTDLQSLTPNLNVGQATGNRSSLVLNIRGQTQTNVDANLDPSVGVYVDGIYVAHLYGANTQLTDISSLQVLRGPQGTLFGRNTPGGALLISTNDPQMDDLSGLVRITGGENGRRNLEAVLNATLVPDLLAVRGAVKLVRSDGYGRNVAAPFQQLGGEHVDNYRFKVLLTPSSDIDLLVSAESFELNEGPGITKLTSFTPTAAAAVASQSNGTDSIANYLNLPGRLAGISPLVIPTPSNTFQFSGPPGSRAKVDQVLGRANWAASSAFELMFLAGYRRTDARSLLDLDGTPYTILHSVTANDFKQYSAELQANGTALTGALNYTAGVYWFHEKGVDSNQKQDTTAKAIFGQASYSIIPQLSATVGLRYSEDIKRPTATARTGAGICGVPVVLRQDPNICAAQFYRKDQLLSYTGSLEFKPVEDVLIYAKTSRGSRSGGFNVRASSTNPLAFAAFKPEQVTDYEIGLKSQFWDRRITFNAALFYDDYAVIQRQATVVNPDGSASGRVTSDASGKVKGAEFELSVMPVDGLRLGGTLGLLDAKYTDFQDSTVVNGVVVVTDRTAEPFSRTPSYTYTLNASYGSRFSSGRFDIRADWNYSDKFYGINSTIRTGSLPLLTQDGYGTLNLRASINLDNGLELAAYGSNVTNKLYILQSLDLTTHYVNYMGGARELGLEATYRF